MERDFMEIRNDMDISDDAYMNLHVVVFNRLSPVLFLKSFVVLHLTKSC